MVTRCLMGSIDRSALVLVLLLQLVIVRCGGLMSLHFSANQFEDGYSAERLGNWQVAKHHSDRPRARRGATRPVSDEAGHFRHSARTNSSLFHDKIKSAPAAETSGLFISGSAVASSKNGKSCKKDALQGESEERKPNQSRESATEEDGEDVAAEADYFKSVKMSLPDNPRQAALVLAQRQKKHRPLPDLIHESNDVLIPKMRTHPTTVESTKAKGPTSCTKRQVILLIPESETVFRQPNVMDLAIKWDAITPPSSAAGRNKKLLRNIVRKPAEKTLDWLYDTPAGISTVRPEYPKNVTSESVLSVSSSAGSLTSVKESKGCSIGGESEPESGYNSPRTEIEELNPVDLEPVKVTLRSSASAAASAKNHFIVSSAFGAKMNRSDSQILLPEYPLQRHSSSAFLTASARSKTSTKTSPSALQVQHDLEEEEVEEEECAVNALRDRDSDSGFGGDRLEDNDNEREQDKNRIVEQGDVKTIKNQRNRNQDLSKRLCLACHSLPVVSRSAAPVNTTYKSAMKAGLPSSKNRSELEKIIERRQNYRAPKPTALSSHARYIRGTLAPPLSAGCGIEPLVDYPDFKRLDSTYRISYGAHQLMSQQHRKRRPKTLTAILNEKNCRQWRS